jgi:hypothetical protein
MGVVLLYLILNAMISLPYVGPMGSARGGAGPRRRYQNAEEEAARGPSARAP